MWRPLPDNTKHSQETGIHFPGVIQSHNSRKRAAADLRLRWCGHWHQPECAILHWFSSATMAARTCPQCHVIRTLLSCCVLTVFAWWLWWKFWWLLSYFVLLVVTVATEVAGPTQYRNYKLSLLIIRQQKPKFCSVVYITYKERARYKFFALQLNLF